MGRSFRSGRGRFTPHGAPALIGEFGIPYDLDEGAAFAAWARGERDPAIWDKHSLLLGLMYDALDTLLLNATQWNYTASNRNDLRIGDGWNQEDLSIFSRDQQDDPADPDSGGRAVKGFCRPFARYVQGRIQEMRFDRARGTFILRFDADEAIDAPTEICPTAPVSKRRPHPSRGRYGASRRADRARDRRSSRASRDRD